MKALIIDSDSSHATGVRTRFLNRYAPWTVHIAMVGSGSPSGSIVTYQATVADCIQYAIDNDYNLIVRNYSDGYGERANYALAFAAGIPAVVSDGANDPVDTGNKMTVSPWFVGGGVIENEESYSDGMEVFDASTTNETAESWAVASFGARVAKAIDDFADANLWDLRQRMRQAASYYSSGWIQNGGYGRAGNAAAGTIGVSAPVDIVATKAGNNQTVTFTWKKFATSTFSKTRIVRDSDGEVIYEGTAETCTYYSIAAGNESFTFHTVSTGGVVTTANSSNTVTVTGLSQYQLSAPTNLAYSISGLIATISWTAVSLASSYTIQRSADNGSTWSAVGTSTSATITDELELANFGYLYRVKATAPDYADSEYSQVYVGRFPARENTMIPTAAL